MAEHFCVALVPLFNHLKLDEQQKVNALAKHQLFKKGEQIMSPGDEKLVIVANGSMKVYQLSASGKEQLLRIVEPGGYEGENQLLGASNESIFAEALEPTEICWLDKQEVTSLLLQYPNLMLRLLTINAQKFLQLEQQTQFLSIEKVEERLALYLCNLAKSERSLQFTLTMKMKELATFLGTTPETLSRKFKQLETNKILHRKGRQIHILNIRALQAIIEEA